jgi:hypothetical protein
MFTEQRCDEARTAIEDVIESYSDVFCADTEGSGEELHLPVLRAWVLVTVHDDANDLSIGATFQMTKQWQALHETLGLFDLARSRALREDSF